MEASENNKVDEIEALRALEFQLSEGIDEWIVNAPQSRFAQAQEALASKAQPAQEPLRIVKNNDATSNAIEVGAQLQVAPEPKPVDFSEFQNYDEIIEALKKSLPKGFQAMLSDAVPDWGGDDAEILVIVDPPYRDAAQARTLSKDPTSQLLYKSLQAIDLDVDAATGREPVARVRFMPLSPWRIPQDRKLLESEAEVFHSALKARLQLLTPRLILYAGSNLGDLEAKTIDGQLYGVTAIELVSPRMMLKEPLLKRLHWQKLLRLNQDLKALLQP